MSSCSTEPISRRELAALLGVTDRAVVNLEDKGMPVDKGARHPRYSAPACIRWYVRAKVDEAMRRRAPVDLLAARARKTGADADRSEMLRDLERGELIRVEDAGREIDSLLDRLRAVLLAFTNRNAHLLVGKRSIPEVTLVLDKAVYELMDALVRAGVNTEAA